MKSQHFNIRLQAARQMAGLSMKQLSEKTLCTVTKQSISKYEKGLMMPKAETLDALSAALNISNGYFSGESIRLNTPMLRNALGEALPEDEVEMVEAQLAFWAEQYIAAEKTAGMERQFDNPLKSLSITDASDASDAADLLRQAWHCGDGPIPSVLRLMERKGIKMLNERLPGSVLGLSTWANDSYPLVVVDMANEKHTVERLRFTASHELGHLVLNIPDTVQGKDREKLCDKFAGCFLLPKSTLMEEMGSTSRQSVALDELIDLREAYGVSIAALVHELWDFRIISREQYDWWFNERIKKNSKETGWGEYLFPETIGREKRIVSRKNNITVEGKVVWQT